MKKMKSFTLAAALIATAQISYLAFSSYSGAEEMKAGDKEMTKNSTKSFSKYVDDKGNITLPTDFRLSMVHLGSWFVPEGAASGFHDVYTEAASAKAFRETGKFPDGATLVKELRSSHSGNYTTGSNVKYAKTDGLKQWFVMIKDTKGRFKGNAHWEKGWGWALFKTDKPKNNVSRGFKQECFACHAPVEKTDWVYTEAYPTLKQLAGEK